MRIKAVIFDLDGTLVSTKPDYRYEITNKALSRFSIKKDRNDVDKFWFGTERNKIISEWGLDAEKFWEVFHKTDNSKLREKSTFVFEDIGVLENLKNMGIRVGLVTGAPVWIADMEMKKLNFEFDATVLANDMHGIKVKPHPEGIIECIKLLDVDKDSAVFIGNGEEDIEAAKNAGVISVLLERKEHDTDHIKPAYKIETLMEISDLLSKL